MIAGPYQTVILGERLVDILRVEMLCQLGSKMLRECLLCLPCLSTRDLSFPTAVLQSHYQGCHVTSFGFSQPTFILWSRSLFWWSSGRDEVTSLRCCRLCQSDPSFGSVSFTPVPLLSLCALQGGGIGGRRRGGGTFIQAVPPGSCLPVVPPLLCRQMGHFFTPPPFLSLPTLSQCSQLGITGIESRSVR